MAGKVSVRVAPQLEQVKVLMPSAVQVASWVTLPPSQLCPLAGMVCWAISTAPQVEHLEPSVRPASVQVAALPGTVTGVWSAVFAMASVRVAPQRVQVKVLTPSAAQVGAWVTTPLSQPWPRGSMFRTSSAPQRVQV